MMIILNKSVIEKVANIEYVMSLINAKYFILSLSKIIIEKMSTSINVRNIENVLHQSNVYVMLNLYLDELFNDKKISDHIRREFYVVDNLKCKLLMKLDIMISEKMIINLANKSFIIFTCENLIISIRINLKSNSRIRRIIHSKKFVVISSNSVMSVSIYLRDKKLSFNRNFLFESNHDVFTISLENLDEFYTHVCDCNLKFVHVRNELFKSVIIFSRTKLDLLTEYEKENTFKSTQNIMNEQ